MMMISVVVSVHQYSQQLSAVVIQHWCDPYTDNDTSHSERCPTLENQSLIRFFLLFYWGYEAEEGVPPGLS